MDDQKADDKQRFLDLYEKLEALVILDDTAMTYDAPDASAVFSAAIVRTLRDLADIVDRAAGGDA